MTDATISPPDVSRGSMAVAAFSTVVEWYDFTLYLYLATLLSRVFFGGGAAALAGSANSAAAPSAVEVFSISRLDHFRSCMAFPVVVRPSLMDGTLDDGC